MMTFMMKPTIKTIIFGTMLGIAVFLPAPARALPPIPQPCVDGTLPSGALSLMCVPLGWNGQLVVFAHGYVAPEQPIAFYNLALPDGTSLPDFIQSLGFAFATTSYRQNGLAILEGADDIRELVAEFGETHSPLRTYVTGVSEGGLVAALLAERSPELFFSGLATCGTGPPGTRNAGHADQSCEATISLCASRNAREARHYDPPGRHPIPA
jgi:pimeloyl-ACP methyl ester carboxylesterase